MKYLILIFCFPVFLGTLKAQVADVNLNDFIKETQVLERINDRNLLVWWIPNSYWRIATKNKAMGPSDSKMIENTFGNYVVFCLIDYKTSGAQFTFRDEKTLRTLSTLFCGDQSLKALPESEYDETMRLFMSYFKPIFSNLLGQMGEGMTFLLFKKLDNCSIDENKKSDFSFQYAGKKISFVTPLACLLPPKNCPIDGQKMAGNWEYCPFHGTKLKQ